MVFRERGLLCASAARKLFKTRVYDFMFYTLHPLVAADSSPSRVCGHPPPPPLLPLLPAVAAPGFLEQLLNHRQLVGLMAQGFQRALGKDGEVLPLPGPSPQLLVRVLCTVMWVSVCWAQ